MGSLSDIQLLLFLPGAFYDPPVVENGSHNIRKEYYLRGEILHYTCDFVYYTENSISRRFAIRQATLWLGETLM